MGYALKDIRFTVRRAGVDDPTIFPHLLRDRSALPKIAYAIDYFERLVGKERRDLDAELFVSFFGDHKLARSMIAALGTSYRFRARRIDEVVNKTAARRLAAHGIVAPKLLRLALFDDVNTSRSGFTPIDEREAAYADLAVRLKVRPAEIERLLYLDLDEHAVLHRVGPRARPEDVSAQFNFGVLELLLRQAESVELNVREVAPNTRATARRIGLTYGISVDTTSARTLRLIGRQDALGNWSRHGRKLARATLELLERGQSDITEGLALLALPNRRVRLRLTSELLSMLAVAKGGQADWQDDLAVREAILDRVCAEIHRRPGNWSLRRLPDPVAGQTGVILADLRLRSTERHALLCAVRSVEHARRLAAILDTAATPEPYVFVGVAEALAPLRSSGATCISSDSFDTMALEACLSTPITATGEAAPITPG